MSNLAYKYEDERRTEILDGQIYAMASPSIRHADIVENINRIFQNYLKGKKCKVYPDRVDVHLTKNDVVIPDISVVCDTGKIGENHILGAPDLIAEVLSPSTHQKDRGYKKGLYEKCGVKEYWIVDILSRSIEVYHLIDGKYDLPRVYQAMPEGITDETPERYRPEVVTEFSPSMFEDLVIRIDEVFAE